MMVTSEVVIVVLVYVSHQYCFCVAMKTFHVFRGTSGFLYFLVILLLPPTCKRHVQSKHEKTRYMYNW